MPWGANVFPGLPACHVHVGLRRHGQAWTGEGGRAREGDRTTVTAVTAVTPVYSVHRRSMWSRRVMSSARVIGRGMPQWAMWKLLRKPEGSIWPGPLGNLPSHFTFRDKEKQRCNVLARAAIGGPTATARGNSSEPGRSFAGAASRDCHL